MIENFISNSGIEFYKNASLKKYNTYRIDAKVKYLIFPKNYTELSLIFKFIKDNSIDYLVLGNGSNIIFSQKYYNYIMIKLDRMKAIKIKDDSIWVEAGYSLVKLASEASKKGLSGLEFASAIPGFIGASIAMNAGAYKHSLDEVVESVRVIDDNLNLLTFKKEELDFNYRHSIFKNNKKYIIIDAQLKLEHGNYEEIQKIINNRRMRRLASQPLEYPSAGSVFRNPTGMYAGELIEKCGLKGYSIGGAKISEKHANFIINYNNATGKDIVKLINKVYNCVKEKYGVSLILEQIIV